MSKPELIIGLVGPIGTDLASLYEVLKSSLKRFDYTCNKIRLIDCVAALEGFDKPRKTSETEVYDQKMNFGNTVRERLEAHDALALLGAKEIARLRENSARENPTAYILHSIKHPAEVKSLRQIYGESFLLFAGYAPRSSRLSNLTGRLGLSRASAGERTASRFIERDEDEGLPWGQRTRDTFHLADFFIDLEQSEFQITQDVDRVLDILFGHPYRTPNRDEYGMFMAFAAARRSAALGRQVGACICDEFGEVLAVGMNEVPKPGGGSYWDSEEPDFRDFQTGEDSNDRHKLLVLKNVLEQLQKHEWLSQEKAQKNLEELADELVATGVYRSTYIRDLIEFGRCVHAEMYALTDCIRRGISVRGCVLYVTTFPCHGCTRHIIASGISKVVFIEPYAKSLGPVLHSDAIEVEPSGGTNKIPFIPFVGVSPSLYFDLFRMPDSRKDSDGRKLIFKPENAMPRRNIQASYELIEQGELEVFDQLLKQKGFREREIEPNNGEI